MMRIRNMGDCLVGAVCAPQGCDTVPDAAHPDNVSFLYLYVDPETENPRNTLSGSIGSQMFSLGNAMERDLYEIWKL